MLRSWLLLAGLNRLLADGGGGFNPLWVSGLTAPLSGFVLNDGEIEIDLAIDPLRYRSSSQGPVMEEEEISPRDDEIDEVIDRATRVGATLPVIPQFTGSATLAWRVWRGTIVEQVWPSAALSMLVPAMLVAAARTLNVPDVASPLIMHLSAVSTGWNYMLTCCHCCHAPLPSSTPLRHGRCALQADDICHHVLCRAQPLVLG